VTDRRPPALVDSGLSRAEREVLERLELPVILLVGGATGTGKSTVTVEVAHRLGITRVTSTDTVRQTMRAFFSREFMPSIHYSSFEAGPAVTVPDDEATDSNLLGFLDQTRNVLVGARAVLDRAVEEGYSMAIEGVHLVPGLVGAPRAGALVCECMLAISDESEHARHFWVRDASSDGLRSVDRYLQALPQIRLIQEHLIDRAQKTGVPVIENVRRDETVEAVLRLVLDRAQATHATR
jgi:2-phosphoglycerate kinase